jgi:hypothetical protein
MLRPEAFQQPFVALRNIPYLCGGPESQDQAQGGVLCMGQTVRTRFSAVPDRRIRSEAAFVEGVGIVSLNPHWLIPASMLRSQKENTDGEHR